MEQGAKSEDSLSFMDQCTVICLCYVSSSRDLEIQYDEGGSTKNEKLETLCSITDQELTEFGNKDDLQGFFNAATQLAHAYENTEFERKKVSTSLTKLKSSLDQETFNECADAFINLPVDSWNKVASVLHLIFKTCEQHDTAMVGTVIDIGVRYLRKTVTYFVTSQGGWKSISMTPTSEYQDDIGDSIVVIPHESEDQQDVEATGDARARGVESPTKLDISCKSTDLEESPAKCEVLDNSEVLTFPKNETPVPLSPLDTPPFSIPSSVNTDDDRESLATPPEIVERPVMTESYIQAMGVEELIKLKSGDGNGFEMVGSDNGATSPDRQNSTSPRSTGIDDVQAFDVPEFSTETVIKYPNSEPEKEQKKEMEQTEKDNESILGGYLPHFTIGVAAAAALAGFFVLKNNV